MKHKLTSTLMILGILVFSGCGSNTESQETTAMNKIIAFVESGTPIPTIEDYELAGVVGVTEIVLVEINQVISNLTKEEIDTKEEIQVLLNALGVKIVQAVPKSSPKSASTSTPTSTSTSTSTSTPTPVAPVPVPVLPISGVDTIKPVITLIGAEKIYIKKGTTYVDAGAKAQDNIDGDITNRIIIGGDTVNTNAIGTYVISYTVSDKAGNETLPRTIRVIIVS